MWSASSWPSAFPDELTEGAYQGALAGLASSLGITFKTTNVNGTSLYVGERRDRRLCRLPGRQRPDVRHLAPDGREAGRDRECPDRRQSLDEPAGGVGDYFRSLTPRIRLANVGRPGTSVCFHRSMTSYSSPIRTTRRR